MRLVTTDAIVLRSYNLAESDRIVLCLTRNSGLIRAVAKGARRESCGGLVAILMLLKPAKTPLESRVAIKTKPPEWGFTTIQPVGLAQGAVARDRVPTRGVGAMLESGQLRMRAKVVSATKTSDPEYGDDGRSPRLYRRSRRTVRDHRRRLPPPRPPHHRASV